MRFDLSANPTAGDTDENKGLALRGGTSVSYEEPSPSGAKHASALISTGQTQTASLDQVPNVAMQGTIPRAGSATRVSRYFAKCREAIREALENHEDVMAINNAMQDYQSGLAALWEERGNRERAFGLLVNRLQTMLLDVDVETISKPALKAVDHVVREASYPSRLTASDVKSFNQRLNKAGCDVFTGLRARRNSGDPA